VKTTLLSAWRSLTQIIEFRRKCILECKWFSVKLKIRKKSTKGYATQQRNQGRN
jgi:hypothetical protein